MKINDQSTPDSSYLGQVPEEILNKNGEIGA